MSEEHTREEILSLLESVEVAVVATSAGQGLRCRMMHYAFDENFNLYLATMKGNPPLSITENQTLTVRYESTLRLRVGGHT